MPLPSLPVIEAIANFAGTLLNKVLEPGYHKDDKSAAAATKVMSKAYDTLRTDLTDGLVRVLKLLENGENLPYSDIRMRVYPSLKLTPEFTTPFDEEFKYRLEFLRLHGLLMKVGSGPEYTITKLGQAFLQEARGRRDY